MSEAAIKATADDRQWFAAHPDRCYRVRGVFPGEMADVDPKAPQGWLAVHQIRPGVRVRAFCGFGAPPDGDEATARYCFQQAIEHCANLPEYVSAH